MNPEFPPNNPRAELEARLTAFILGELPAHEAAALRQAMDEDTELAALYKRLKMASKLVREAAASPTEQAKEQPAPLRLSEERRQKLLAQFKTVAPKEFVREDRNRKVGIRILQIAAVVAMMAILAGLLLPSLAKSKSKSLSATYRLREMEIAQSRQAGVQALRSLPPNHEQTDNRNAASKSAGRTFADSTSAPVILGNIPRPANTTIVLPPAENLTENSTLTMNGYFDNSWSWNPGHQPKTASAKPYIVNAEPQDVVPVLQDLFNTGKAFGSSSSVNTPQNSALYQRSQTLSSPFNSNAAGSHFEVQGWSGKYANYAAAAASGNAGPKAAIGYANPSDISAALSQFAANSGRQPSGGAVTFVTNFVDSTGDPYWIGLLEHPVQRHSDSNFFVDRSSFIAMPADEKLDIAQNQASSLNLVAGNNSYNSGAGGTTTSPTQLGPTGERKGGDIESLTGMRFARLSEDGSLDTSFDPGPGVFVAPPQVEIKTKFADVTPNIRAENITNAGTFTFATGGTVPSLGAVAGSDYAKPFGLFPGSAPERTDRDKDLLTAPEVKTESGRTAGSVPVLGDVPTIGHLVHQAQEHKDYKKADELYTRMLVIDPGNSSVLAARRENRKLLDAQEGTIPSPELVERIPSWHTNEVRTATMIQDGKLLFEAGKLDEAETKLAEAYQLDPGSVAAQQYLELIREKRMADATRRSGLHSEDAILQVEKSWDVEQRQGKLEPRTHTLADSGVVGYEWSLSGTQKPFYNDNFDTPVDEKNDRNRQAEANFTLTPPPASTNYVPGYALNAATDEAIRRESDSVRLGELDRQIRDQEQKVDGLRKEISVVVTDGSDTKQSVPYDEAKTALARLKDHRAALAGKQFVSTNGVIVAASRDNAATNGVYPATTEMGNVTVSVDPESKRVFFITDSDSDTAVSVSNSIIQIDRNGGSNPPNVLHYNNIKIEAEAEYAKQEKLLKELKKLTPEELEKNLPAVAPDAVLTQLVQDKKTVETKLDKLKNDLGDQNPEVLRTQKLLDDYKRDIDLRAKGIIQGLEITVNSKQAQARYSEAKLADTPLPKSAADAPIPQPEVMTGENAFSTFSLNIADVSFKLAAASLEKGRMPDPSTIRSEEFINAFDYRDPEPAPGAPLGFAWERAQYPFAHNRDLLRFAVKTAAAGREAGRPMNIVLLLDKSGSMERADRVQIIHEALRVLATQLGPQDRLSVVTFARVARLWVDGLPGSQAGEVVEGLDKLTPEGGTNLEEAMRLAYETARRHYLAGGINRVVLLTDGAANLGNVDPESLRQKVEQHRKEGIALDCFGVGWEGYNDDLLEVLSRHGDGRYGFINTPEEAANGFAKQLAGALHVAAADVKVQVEFNPKRVTAYRQIGYAKHQLTKEQFRDNTVDAAEIGVAESGNALYVVEVNPNGEGPLATVRVRHKVPGTEDYPEHEWSVPYTGNATPLEQASPAMRLAGAASAFSESLATSPFAGEVTSDQLLGLMRGVPETYGADERPKKLVWMIRQAKSLTGK